MASERAAKVKGSLEPRLLAGVVMYEQQDILHVTLLKTASFTA
jgi:hypothetical protein